MTTTLHSFAERSNLAGQWSLVPWVEPLPPQSPALFSWLGGVRRGAAPKVVPLAENRGIPDDASAAVHETFRQQDEVQHNISWVSVSELLDFDYDSAVVDLRAAYAPAPCQAVLAYHALLGGQYFSHLLKLKKQGVERIVFWFTTEIAPDDAT